MLSLRKISQDIQKSSINWIPLPPLDRIWTNETVYNYFCLTKTDIDIIKNTEVIGFLD